MTFGDLPPRRGDTVLVTGGAGSIGKVLVRRLLQTKASAIRVFDSDEYGLFQLNRELNDKRLRLLLGDIKDEQRVDFALKDVDVVFHLAAAKNIEITEYNAAETFRVNILGTLNMVERSLSNGIGDFIFVSSDKAVYPETLYGTTKLIGEHATLWAQRVAKKGRYSVARFGNVIESRGNVFDIWRQQNEKGQPFTLTEPGASRYFWRVDQAADFLLKVADIMEGGEIFIPPMAVASMEAIFRREYPGKDYVVTGLRGKEKLHERLLTEAESMRARIMSDGISQIKDV